MPLVDELLVMEYVLPRWRMRLWDVITAWRVQGIWTAVWVQFVILIFVVIR